NPYTHENNQSNPSHTAPAPQPNYPGQQTTCADGYRPRNTSRHSSRTWRALSFDCAIRAIYSADRARGRASVRRSVERAADRVDERVHVVLGRVPRAHPANLAGVLIPDVERELPLERLGRGPGQR